MKDEERKLYFVVETTPDEFGNTDWKLQTYVMDVFRELSKKGYKISLHPEFSGAQKEGNVFLAFYIPEELFQEWNK